MCRAEFDHSALKGVGINTEPPKFWSPETLLCLPCQIR